MSDDKKGELSRYIEPVQDFMTADEPVRRAYRRMDANSLRTLLVIKDDSLLGLLEWQDIRELSGSADPIEQYTRTECPMINENMSVDEAMAIFEGTEVALGRVPVIDSDGKLVGEISREEFQGRLEHAPNGDDGQQEVLAEDLRQARGTTVLDDSGEKLGTLNGVKTEGGQVTGILVKHGRLRKKYKPVPLDDFDRHEGDTIYLKIGKAEFKLLGDI